MAETFHRRHTRGRASLVVETDEERDAVVADERLTRAGAEDLRDGSDCPAHR
jgi:hypothetical protein